MKIKRDRDTTLTKIRGSRGWSREIRSQLPAISSEFLMLILHLRETDKYGEPDDLREKILMLLGKWEQKCLQENIDSRSVMLSKIAMIAFLDETIITSKWESSDIWMANPLQLELFDRYDLGVEFFKNLTELQSLGKENHEVLEIYYYCMALGFQGRFIKNDEDGQSEHDDIAELRSIMKNTFSYLARHRGNGSLRLSPHGLPRDQVAAGLRIIRAWIVLVFIGGLSVIVYVILSIWVSNNADDLRQTIESFLKS